MCKSKYELAKEMLEAGRQLLELRREAILAGKPLPWQQKQGKQTSNEPRREKPNNDKPKPKQKLPLNDRIDQITSLYLAGASVKDISAKLDVNTQVIYSEIRLARQTGRIPQKINKKAEVLRLIQSGVDPKEAAASVGGVSHSYLKKIKRSARQKGILKDGTAAGVITGNMGAEDSAR